MDKKELFDAFDGFSQNLLVTLAEIDSMKQKLLLNENARSAVKADADANALAIAAAKTAPRINPKPVKNKVTKNPRTLSRQQQDD